VQRSAARRDRGLRVADFEAAKARVSEVCIRRYGQTIGRIRDTHARGAAAAERIAAIEVIVEVGEMELGCTQAERLRVRGDIGVEGERRRTDGHATGPGVERSRRAAEFDRRIAVIESVDRTFGNRDPPGNRGRTAATRHANVRLKRSFGILRRAHDARERADIGLLEMYGEAVVRVLGILAQTVDGAVPLAERGARGKAAVVHAQRVPGEAQCGRGVEGERADATIGTAHVARRDPGFHTRRAYRPSHGCEDADGAAAHG
jgi:hypothetical protein